MNLLTHRQRLRFTLNHQQPDRVPLDFGTGGNTSPVPEAYAGIAAHFGLPAETPFVPHIMRLAQVDERILQALDIDTRPVYMNPVAPGKRPCHEPGAFYDDWGVKWKDTQVGGAIYREVAEYPLANATLDDLEAYPWWPDPLDPARCAGVAERAERLYVSTDYALVGCPAFNGVWERAYMLCGYQRMLEGLALEQEFVHAVFERITAISVASLECFLAQAGPYLEVVKLGDDLGSQANALMSPAAYRRMIQPYHRRLCECVHRHSPARVFMHSCGAVRKLLPDLIAAGVEILNPVQVSARDMDTHALKQEFGDRLSFWGAIDTQQVLPHGSENDVRLEVQRRIGDLAPGGGYVLAPVHNIQADVPPANVIAMYTHAREFVYC